jgi:hypothetical protein
MQRANDRNDRAPARGRTARYVAVAAGVAAAVANEKGKDR